MKTRHVFGTLTVLAALATALTAQQPAPQGKNPDGKSPESVIARIARDMQAAEQRLKKTDTGELTRKIQRDVVDGLDELIKQNEQSQNGKGGESSAQQGGLGRQQGGATGGSSRYKSAGQEKQQGAASKESEANQDQPAQAKGGKADGQLAKNKDQGKEQAGGDDDKQGKGKEGGKKDGDKKDGKGTAKGSEQGKEPGQQGGMASVKNEKSLKPKSNLTAETYREDWGHLPLQKRMEMDAYSKEKFMVRYDEILQQYYRAVAEYGRGKEK
jgi:hypothetical protein